MEITPIFDPLKAGRSMRVACFMSGSGTNVIKLLELEKALKDEEGSSPFEVVFLFSDRSDGKSRGEAIAMEYGLPYVSYDIRAFHRLRGFYRSVNTPEGMKARRAFDRVPALLARAFEVDLVALGGYMSYTTLEGCVNVHPADLSIKNSDGSRRYVGDRAVLDAIAAGEMELRSSTIWTDQGVDTGPILVISEPVPVTLPCKLEEIKADPERLAEVADLHQERLKETGDWKIFPLTVEMVSRGRFAFDRENRVYLDGEPLPDGYRLP